MDTSEEIGIKIEMYRFRLFIAFGTAASSKLWMFVCKFVYVCYDSCYVCSKNEI